MHEAKTSLPALLVATAAGEDVIIDGQATVADDFDDVVPVGFEPYVR